MGTPTTELTDAGHAFGGVDQSIYHRAVRDACRRTTLAVLEERGAPLGLDALADTVAERSDDDAEQVRVSLHHVHLPMLDDAGAIEYDHEVLRVEEYCDVGVSIED